MQDEAPCEFPERKRVPVPITRLNHAVLYVRDLERSLAFYQEVLGFHRLPLGFPGAAFLRAPGSDNDHDLGLFEMGDRAGPSPAGRSAVGLYHLAWEDDTLQELARLAGVLSARGALSGASDHGTTKSLYGADPDGIQFEVAWLVPTDLLDDDARRASARIERLDIAREKKRYGPTTPGGGGRAKVSSGGVA